MSQGNADPGEEWLSNLERQLQSRGMEQELLKQEVPQQSQQQLQQQEFYKPELSPEDQELNDKLKGIDAFPRKTREERDTRIRKLESVLGLTAQEFRRLYQICYLGSKDNHPDGYHVAVQKDREAHNPKVIPIDLAEDLLGTELQPCYSHYVGFITGAIARDKPYEALQFIPHRELEQIIKATTQEYNIVSRQNPHRNYRLKPEEDIVTAVIFEDNRLYADEAKRQAVVDYLHTVNDAIQSFKEGQITRDELVAVIRGDAGRETKPAQIEQEQAAIAEAQQTPEVLIPAGVYEIGYVPSSPERMEDINLMLNNLGHMLKTPFSFLYTEEGKRAKVSLRREATQEYFNGIAPLAQRLDVIIGMWRKDPAKGKEVMDNIYQAFGTFGQQQQ